MRGYGYGANARRDDDADSGVLPACDRMRDYSGAEGASAGAEWTQAPEELLGWEHGREVDWWAYGIVVGWMLSGQVCGLSPA